MRYIITDTTTNQKIQILGHQIATITQTNDNYQITTKQGTTYTTDKLSTYKDKLSAYMEEHNYYTLPNYPFKESLNELPITFEVEKYCYNVLRNLLELHNYNTITQPNHNTNWSITREYNNDEVLTTVTEHRGGHN